MPLTLGDLIAQIGQPDIGASGGQLMSVIGAKPDMRRISRDVAE